MPEITRHKQEIEENKKQCEKRYRQEKNCQFQKILFFLFFLLLSSFGQFAILENSFEVRFDLSNSDKIFGVEIKALLSFLVTAALPLTTLIDESQMLGKKIKISLLWGKKISPIWIILFFDTLLTLQAVLATSNPSKDYWIGVIAFTVAIVFSIFVSYLSQAIVATGREFMSARKKLQIVTQYGIDPEPLYEDIHHIELQEKCDTARKEADQVKKELEQIVAAKQNLESEKVQDREQLQQLQSQQAEKIQKIQELEQKINSYKDHADAISQLKTKFSKVTKPMISLMEKAQEFASVYELSKDLTFPKLEIAPDQNGKVVEKPTYYGQWPNPNGSWDNIKLPSELSPAGRVLFNAMQQQKDLPAPNVRNYAPRNGLSKCLVFSFEDYGVIVYCRDEEYRKDGSKWDEKAETDYQRKLADDQSDGYLILPFSVQQIMQDQLAVLELIKDKIELKQNSTGV